jgi:hypothetical protein
VAELTFAKEASVSLADEKGEGVERSEDRVLLEFLAKGLVFTDEDFFGIDAPGFAKGALFVCTLVFSPEETETDEVGISYTFRGWNEKGRR